MKSSTVQAIAATALFGLASATPVHRRQVPQEHSHDFILTITNEFLKLDNPKNINDAVFGLLGNAAAAGGAGSVTNLDCLKQETADQAFTNAKAAKDLRGMAGALLYQSIERNTGKVGLASAACTEKATNPEVAALSSHQDAAATGASAINKKITLELAKQLATLGADPKLALLSGTFAPGDPADPTAKGNSCDDVDPTLGCIYSKGLLILDASEAEIDAATKDVKASFAGGKGGITAASLVDLSKFSVADGGDAGSGADVSASAAPPAASTPPAVPSGCIPAPPQTCSLVTTTVAATSIGAVMASMTSAIVGQVTEAPAPTGTDSGTSNLQTFAGALGGPPPPVESSAGDRPFSTNGATFNNLSAALGRSCDVQHNKCANAANSGQLSGGTAQCESQNSACRASIKKRQAGLNFGSCSDPSIAFGLGFDGRDQDSFQPSNTQEFTHGSALNAGVITSFICGQLESKCKASADAVAACQKGATAAGAATGQAAADAFNGALNVAATPAATSTADPASSTGGGSAALDLGSCSDPSIIFAAGLDGRSGEAFAPNNKGSFDHGSANNIKVITGFICSQLQNACKASQAAIDACKQGATAADAAQGEVAVAAFNAAMGVGAVAAPAPTAAPTATAAPAPSVVMTITQCA